MCTKCDTNKKTAEDVAVGVATATIKGLFRLTAGTVRGVGKVLVVTGNAIAHATEEKKSA